MAMQTVEREHVDPFEVPSTTSNGNGSRTMPAATSVGTVLRWTIATLMLGAGAIHFGMMGEHAGISWTHGLFFASAAWLQLGLAAMIGFRPSRNVVLIGIALNVGILVLYVLTRVMTISWIEGTPDAWGNVDRLCAVFEVLAVFASIALLNKRFASRPLSASVGFSGIGFIVVLVAVLTSLIFSPAAGSGGDGHNHSHGGTALGAGGDGHSHSHAAIAGPGGLVDTGAGVIVTGALTNDSPCERSGPPVSPGQVGATKDAEGHNHRGPFKQDPLNQADTLALQAEQAQARTVADRYPTVAAAEAAGYRKSTPYVPCIGAHYTNTGLVSKFDPAAPSEVLFDGTAPDSKIVGLSYLVFHLNGPPEGFTGPNDRWHQHNFNGGLCLNRESVVIGNENTTPKQCAARGGRKVPLDDVYMLHDWIVPGWECSWGVFAAECPELGGRIGGTAWDPPAPGSLGAKVAAGGKQ
jgi:hypothetical protein